MRDPKKQIAIYRANQQLALPRRESAPRKTQHPEVLDVEWSELDAVQDDGKRVTFIKKLTVNHYHHYGTDKGVEEFDSVPRTQIPEPVDNATFAWWMFSLFSGGFLLISFVQFLFKVAGL